MLYTVVWPVISACGVHVYETYTHILLHSDYCNFRLSPPVEWHLRMDTLYKVGGKCQSVHVENGHQNWNTTHSLHNVSHFTLLLCSGMYSYWISGDRHSWKYEWSPRQHFSNWDSWNRADIPLLFFRITKPYFYTNTWVLFFRWVLL